MSKLDEKIAAYVAESKKLGLSLDEAFIAKVTKGIGPSIYNADSETVAASDPEELNRVKQNFLIKKIRPKRWARFRQGTRGSDYRYWQIQ
jgi:hypothetical protein